MVRVWTLQDEGHNLLGAQMRPHGIVQPIIAAMTKKMVAPSKPHFSARFSSGDLAVLKEYEIIT